ncbi:sterol desaturase [Alcanivorax sp. S71-1-4]|uniref:sterol desaturase family protein n=1 Tax=Alcanivorax sp. S71-1-4 TaxID=1177159 RepID=UPI00135920A3|nr:sterol desaturase family protein [Alcanivorax sp. S71-1-4]KAF0809320.1 sterol desaturase [Alcanivorax sp. S71-1-4]
MDDMASLLLLGLAPVFVGCVAWEAWALRGRGKYTLVDTVSNASLALLHQVSDGLFNVLVATLAYSFFYQHRLFDLSLTPWTILLLFLLQDFFYYWFHRGSHMIRWMWASHVTHHSSERLNLSTAFRQSFTYPVSGMWLFWVPLAWIGFTPQQVIVVVGLNLAYQFFVHTEVVRRLPRPLEYLFNTPSHHRVHHARNPRYIDRNFGGVLIIWDRLFGTFEPERDDEPCEYGITRQIHSHNPFTLTLHEWRDMLSDARHSGSPGKAIRTLFGKPPAHQPSRRD